MIGLSAYVYSMCENKIVGAFIFGLGLLTICAFKLNLFTGKVGEASIKDIEFLEATFLANALGMIIAMLLFKFAPGFISAGIACGSLMQMGVALYSKHPWATVACVAAFLLSGSKHCIAMIFNYQASIEWLVLLLSTIIGNFVGAKIVALSGITRN